MDYRIKVRNGELYAGLNEILKERLPKIKTNLQTALQAFLREKNFEHSLEVICQLEFHPWGQATQWRIEVDFGEYEWSEKIMKPHYLGASVMLEEVAGKRTLHFSFGNYNSFNPKTTKGHSEKIKETQLSNSDFIQLKINAVEVFLKDLENVLLLEIKKIDFKQLEFLEDDE